MSSFAIVTDRKSGIYEPEQLKDVPIAVSPFNGSHFTMLKMMEGFLGREHIKWTNVGTHKERLEALKAGKVKAASLQEPWISVAEKQGCRVLIESHSTRSEAAGVELDGPTLAKMFRAEARAAEAIQKSPEKYAHYIAEETGGLGITNRQYGILLLLKQQPGLDQISVAKLLGLDRSTTGMVLTKLEQDGLVARYVGDHDRRRLRLKLTRAGERMLARLAEP